MIIKTIAHKTSHLHKQSKYMYFQKKTKKGDTATNG